MNLLGKYCVNVKEIVFPITQSSLISYIQEIIGKDSKLLRGKGHFGEYSIRFKKVNYQTFTMHKAMLATTS